MMYNMLQMLTYVCSRYKPVQGGNGGSSLFYQDNTKVELKLTGNMVFMFVSSFNLRTVTVSSLVHADSMFFVPSVVRE